MGRFASAFPRLPLVVPGVPPFWRGSATPAHRRPEVRARPPAPTEPNAGRALRVVTAPQPRDTRPQVSSPARPARVHCRLLLHGGAARDRARGRRARRPRSTRLRPCQMRFPRGCRLPYDPHPKPRRHPLALGRIGPREAHDLTFSSPSPDKERGTGVRTKRTRELGSGVRGDEDSADSRRWSDCAVRYSRTERSRRARPVKTPAKPRGSPRVAPSPCVRRASTREAMRAIDS